MAEIKVLRKSDPSMPHFIIDLPNICSLVGLLSSLLGIYFSILGRFHLALIAILWSVLFDWTDGLIARRMRDRSHFHQAFGAQLDSLIDIVSFGVFPALFLLSYGQFNPWFIPGAFLILAAAAIRLGYFNIYGMVDKTTYKGLALDNNVLILSFIFLFAKLFNRTLFSIVLYIVLLILLIFNLSSVKTHKFAGNWYFALLGYTITMTIILVHTAYKV